MVLRRSLVAFVAVMSLIVVAGSASAEEDSGTETIFGMDPYSVEFENTGSGKMRVSWDVTVTDGVPVNIVLLDEENHERYPGLSYEAYEGHEYSYVNSSRRTVRVGEGTYFLVIESAHSSMDSSTVRYEVSWEEGSGIFDTPWCWPAGLILAMILGVLAALFGRGRGRAGSTVSSTTEAPPVLEPKEAVELGPQPEPPDAPPDYGTGEASEPTAPGTMAQEGAGGGERMLGPQPEPPDMPPAHADPQPGPPGTEGGPRSPAR